MGAQLDILGPERLDMSYLSFAFTSIHLLGGSHHGIGFFYYLRRHQIPRLYIVPPLFPRRLLLRFHVWITIIKVSGAP